MNTANNQRFRALMKEDAVTSPAFKAGNDVAANRLKMFFKRWPVLYMFLRETFGPTHSPWNRFRLKHRVAALFQRGAQPVVLNLGSGATRLHPDIINVDIFPLKEVDLVADICRMPFRDGVVDAIVCDSVLEHLYDTERAMGEMSRILKPGGVLFITGLFLYPYHSSPNDFYRWTDQGIRLILEEHHFSVRSLGIRGGPMGTLQGILMHVCAIPFSFVSQAFYFLLVQFFMVLFSPLKLLDPFFMRFPHSIEVSSDVFIIAEKRP